MADIRLFSLLSIIEFGAVPDGKTDCSGAFSQAMEQCGKAGGGTVYVPAGEYLTGPIIFKSNVTLYLDAGAAVKFVQRKEDYPLVLSRWEGEECKVYSPMIYGRNVENVSIIGQGTLDGQGEYWWKLFREKNIMHPRPRFICFEDSEKILIEGIKIINSPAWTINPIKCNNITVDKLTIKNPEDSPNTDGINPESCKNVHISNCHIDVGDDCITLKSGTEKIKYRIPCENVTISNCTMVHGHGGVVIGSEMSGDIRNIVISNCIFEGTDRGIRLKTRRGRGGTIEDIRINNIIMRKVMCPIVINLYYFCGEGGKDISVQDRKAYPVTESTPVVRGVHISNITAKETDAAAGFIFGLPESPVYELTLNNINIYLNENGEAAIPAMMCNIRPVKCKGIICSNVKDSIFENINIFGCDGEKIEMENCFNIKVNGLMN